MPYLANRAVHDGKFSTKFFLRWAALTSAVVGVIAGTVSFDDYWQDTYIIWFTEGWAVSIVWNLVWLGIMIWRKRPIAPGCIVAFDLISWILFVMAAIWGWIAYSEIGEEWYYNQTPYNTTVGSMSQVLASCGAASSFALISIALHFVLFVFGCIDENRRRKALRASARPTATKSVGNTASVADYEEYDGNCAPRFNECRCNAPGSKKLSRRGRHAIVNCVDCQTPVEIRCAHCAAMHAARNNRDLDVPAYYGPGARLSDIEAGDMEKKAAGAVISEELR